jgi:hypothetical protein
MPRLVRNQRVELALLLYTSDIREKIFVPSYPTSTLPPIKRPISGLFTLLILRFSPSSVRSKYLFLVLNLNHICIDESL